MRLLTALRFAVLFALAVGAPSPLRGSGDGLSRVAGAMAPHTSGRVADAGRSDTAPAAEHWAPRSGDEGLRAPAPRPLRVAGRTSNRRPDALRTLHGPAVAAGAGLGLLPDTEWRKAARDVKTVEHLVAPVRDMFAAIFFVAVGMLIDPAVIARHWPAVAVLTVVVIVGKVVAVSVSAFLTGYPVCTSVQTGMSLAQIGLSPDARAVPCASRTKVRAPPPSMAVAANPLSFAMPCSVLSGAAQNPRGIRTRRPEVSAGTGRLGREDARSR